MKHPLISVIICNCNYGRYIGEAIESVFGQTYPYLELIIIDDGSTDNSRAVIERYVKSNPVIRYYKQPNRGIVPTRNRGLELARGSFLVFLDSDDTIPKDYVAILYKSALSKKLDVIYTNIQCFDGSDRLVEVSEYSLGELKYRNFIDTSALIRKSAIKGRRFDINLNKKLNHEDWDFFLNLALAGAKIGKSKKTYVLYRVHSNSRSLEGVDTDIDKALGSLKYIIEKYAKKYGYSASEQYLKCIKEYMVQIVKAKNITDYNEARIKDLENQLGLIKNSRSYRLGRILTAPVRCFRRG